ncbi:YdeI/OmpD-associated family protein [Microlunatus sp. Gsoil 973]|uniref:YdeI/OmpD-associated family protein n=1 Tax=Microlunatus sp. Gsoil 973 TaxID=2672569 RepID=UPI0012B46DF3|nr:YdeI/OmpD-associated family protein [Microlunatus sp. Gsoil 973]QGN31634.1 DUF1905 domain-containing protein [Microlunatus sp. Gsoil 973]
MQPQRFTGTVQAGPRGGGSIAVPFDPNEVWASKSRHLITGMVGGCRFRGEIVTEDGEAYALPLGPAWLRDATVGVGDSVEVVISPEGPQRADLAEDVAAALTSHPTAGAFFDSLAQFYRKGYLRWVDATKNRPDERERRIEQMITLLEAGEKQRPRSTGGRGGS